MNKIFTQAFLLVFLIAFSCNAYTQTWDAPVQIETAIGTAGSNGSYSSMLVVNGFPAIAYADIAHQNLMYVRAMDSTGTTWSAPVFVDIAGAVGGFPSLQVVNGNPAISYSDNSNQDLKYVRALDAIGATWDTPIAVDVTGDLGSFQTSLQVVSGMPAISYYDATNLDLKYVRGTDSSGTTWGSPVSVDVTGMVGRFSSLWVVNGNPAISYYDVTNGNLKYVRSSNATGAAWNTPVSIDGAADVGQYTSLNVANGNPAISYYDVTNGNLKYVRASDISGTTWSTPVAVDVLLNTGLYTSLQIVNGNPAISYHHIDNVTLRFVRASDASGTAWGAPLEIDISGNGLYTSMFVVKGFPAIAYQDQTNGDLKYVRSTNASGTAWSSPVSWDVNGLVGWYTSLNIVNGNPAVSYFDLSKSDLKFVRASDDSGKVWAAPIAVDVTGNVGWYTSLQTVNGMPAISYRDNTNNDLKYVRATDSAGSTWAVPIAIDITFAGHYNSMQIVNGNPAISYLGNNNLKFVRATDASGTTWAAPVVVEGAGNWQYTSLQIVNGNPAISYHDAINGDLKYVRANDASGTTWAAPVSIDVAGSVGAQNSMNVVNGFPAISYYDATNLDLKFVRASDASGTSWNAPVLIDGTGNTGQHTSLEIVNGFPAISYYDVTNTNLKYVRAADASGTSWTTPVTLSTNGNNGLYTSMVSMGNDVGIAYHNQTKWFPFFIRGVSPPCSLPDVPSLSVSASPICGGDSITISASGDLNNALNWQWYSDSCGGISAGSGTNIVVSPSVSTAYFARGEGGCVIPDSCGNLTVTVFSPPPVTANASASTVCAGTKVTLTGGGANSYSWTGGVTNGLAFAPVSTSGYTVTGTDTNNCTNTAVTSVQVHPLPIVTANASATMVCAGDTVTLTGGGAAAYVWTGGISNGLAFVPGFTNTYTVVGMDLNTCTNKATKTITVNPLPVVIANSNASEVCAGDPVILTGSGAVSYVWTGGVMDGIAFLPVASFSDTVTGTDSNNCTNSAAITIPVNPLPVVSLQPFDPDTVCVGSTPFLLTGGTPDSGSFSGNGVSGGIFSPSLADSGVNLIIYSFTDEKGCTGSASQTIFVYICEGLESGIESGSIVAYPNPNDGKFLVRCPGNILSLEISNVLGEVVTCFSFPDFHVAANGMDQSHSVIDLSNQSDGFYFLHVTSDAGMATEKIVIRK